MLYPNRRDVLMTFGALAAGAEIGAKKRSYRSGDIRIPL